ncbi:hypothetical protein K0M31_009554 [Melipona bicolor]|uniref:Uncharacterized protein n=1 Tax=Melipona bicolor TaxID=60889 RepID=A0AA40FNB0_9HYME|nr:hypothetical protein K0M31_009554 [Melipona bicolor]
MSEGKLAEKENSEAVTLRSKSGETAPEESRETVGGTSRVTSEKEEVNEEDEFTKIWPIGTPWEHLGTEEDSDSEPFERLPLPRTEEEMRALLKKFTHEATVYRSYYKHWKETAEQAIKEVGGRSVLATFLVQGLDKQGKVKKPAPAVTISKSRVPRRAERAKRRGKISTKRSVKSLDEKSTHPAISENDTAATVVDEVDEKRDEPVEEQEEKKEEEQEEKGEEEREEKGEEEREEKGKEEREDHPSNPQPSEEPSKLSPVSSRATGETADESRGIASVTSYLVATAVEADDFTKDCARSLEPVPYIFYLRAEPDIEIATEHDDEQVIAADPDRENVAGSYKRLFFNLTDKPCKGGKPWIL